jgi:hypothetical protein
MNKETKMDHTNTDRVANRSGSHSMSQEDDPVLTRVQMALSNVGNDIAEVLAHGDSKQNAGAQVMNNWLGLLSHHTDKNAPDHERPRDEASWARPAAAALEGFGELGKTVKSLPPGLFKSAPAANTAPGGVQPQKPDKFRTEPARKATKAPIVEKASDAKAETVKPSTTTTPAPAPAAVPAPTTSSTPAAPASGS